MNKEYEIPTLIDVAKNAGVSSATVSRALSRPDLVSDNTLKKVRKAVNEIGYVVNEAARNLRSKKSNTLLLVVPAVSTPFFSQVVSGMEKTATEYGFSILITHSEDSSNTKKVLNNYIQQNRVDGVMIFGGANQYQPDPNQQNNIPIVAVNERIPGSNIPSITVNGLRAGMDIGQYLVGLNHRKIGHIAGPVLSVSSAFDRMEGFRLALAEAGLELFWFEETQYNLESGAKAANKWIALAEKPTAVFCSCDEVSFGFISEIYRHGFRVPHDVSVIGFDDIPLAEYSIPGLTTYRQPHISLGTEAVLTLLDMLRNPQSEHKSKYLEGELVVRESTLRLNN